MARTYSHNYYDGDTTTRRGRRTTSMRRRLRQNARSRRDSAVYAITSEEGIDSTARAVVLSSYNKLNN